MLCTFSLGPAVTQLRRQGEASAALFGTTVFLTHAAPGPSAFKTAQIQPVECTQLRGSDTTTACYVTAENGLTGAAPAKQ